MNSFAARFLRWCPGALGLLLRRKFYPPLLKSCGKGVLFGRFVDLLEPQKIQLGDRVIINDGAVLDGRRSQVEGPAILLADDVYIGNNTTLIVGKSGRITIMQGASFSSFCEISVDDDFTMGRHGLVSAYVRFGDCPPPVGDKREPLNRERKITIGDGCWLGVRVRVGQGACIGHDTIIGAHTTVCHELPPWAIAVGSPARLIGDRRNNSARIVRQNDNR